MTTVITRYHDISTGHRVHGHESKCANLHGHNYRIHFTVMSRKNQLDTIGRVVDFSVVKTTLCEWLEYNWDHKFLIWSQDPIVPLLMSLDEFSKKQRYQKDYGIVQVPFNPTAENMAQYLVDFIGPKLLTPDLVLIEVKIEETAKCSVTYVKEF